MLDWMTRSMGKLTIILIMAYGVVEAIICPFGLADVYNHSDNIKLIKMSKVSIAFDVVEISLVVLPITKLF